MAIRAKTPTQIERMRAAGCIVAEVFERIGELMGEGVTTAELDAAAEEHIFSRGGTPVFKGYRVPGRPAYPASTCISINEEVVHGIPSERKLAAGDLVKIDVGVQYKLYIGDAARTFEVGDVGASKRRLSAVTREALAAGIGAARSGARVSDISRAVQCYVEARELSVVRQYSGHGVGRRMHEDPQIPNFVDRTAFGPLDPVLPAGCTLAIEPMVNVGTWRTKELSNRWTVVTADSEPSAHWEETVVVTDAGGEILTRL
jgi:methionyl aminopeptidase